MEPPGQRIAGRFGACLISIASVVAFACGESAPSGPAGPTGPDGPTDDPAAVLVGRAVTLEGAPPAGSRVAATWPGVEATGDLGADGSFELRLGSMPTGLGTLVVEPPGAAGHHPAWIPLDAGAVGEQIRLVLVPRTWRIQDGEHRGADVAISPAAAADPRVVPSYWGFTFPFSQEERIQTVLDPTLWTAGLSTWDPSAFPVPVALDRPRSTRPASEADSARLWDHVAALEAVLGRDLFRPVPLEALDVQDELHTGAVLVRFADTLDTRGHARTGLVSDWFLSEDVSGLSDTPVTEFRAVGGEIRGAVVLIRDGEALADRRVVAHEMMHALGVGHGCSWTSVQTYCETLQVPLPTAEDVAYLELLEAMRVAERELGTRHGILAGVFGERVVSRGLAPFPSASLVGTGPPPGSALLATGSIARSR